MKRFDRQKYEDSNHYDARQANCDCIQLKYDGWWTRIECLDGEAKLYSRTQRLVGTITIDPLVYGTFIGEYMFGTQWSQREDRKGKVFLFDCWEASGQDTTNFPYKERYALLRANLPLLGESFRLVQNYPITRYDSIWQSFVATNEYEGVVFRRSHGPVGDTLLRQKRKVTKDLRVVGFEPGEGKHFGRLGSLLGESADGVRIAVGGGFEDAERVAIWVNRDQILGRMFEVEGYAEFESGSLRHPQFVRWRDDLPPLTVR